MSDLELERAKALALSAQLPEEIEEDQLEMEDSFQEEQDSEVETGPIEAFGRSAAQTLLFDFADEAEAGMVTLYNSVTGEGIESASEVNTEYAKNLASVREEYRRNAEEYPTADKLGIGAGIAASLLTGSAAARGISKVGGVVAPSIVSGFSGLSKAQKAATIGGVHGAVSSLGKSEEKLSLEGALQMAGGAALGTAGGAVLSKVADAVGGVIGGAIKPEQSKLIIRRALKGIGINTARQNTKLRGNIERKGMTIDSFIREIADERDVVLDPATGVLKETNEKLIGNIFDGTETQIQKVQNKVVYYAKERDKILAKSTEKMDRNEYANRIKASLSGKVKPGDREAINTVIANSVTHKLVYNKDFPNGILEEIGGDITAKGMLSIRKQVDGLVNFDSVSNPNKLKRLIRDAMNDIEDDVIGETVGKSAKLASQKFRHKMSNLYEVDSALQGALENEFSGGHSLIRDALYGNMAGKATGMDSHKAMLGIFAARMANSSSAVNRSAAFNALQLGNALPNVSERSLRRLLITVDADSILPFSKAMASVIGESDFRQAPLARTSEDVLSRKESVLAIVNDFDSDLALSLREAIDSGDMTSVNTLMDQFSKNPESEGLIEPGIGWEGKVYSPEDKLKLKNELRKAAREGSISFVERKRLEIALDMEGIIPQPEPQERQPQLRLPRDKNKHTY